MTTAERMARSDALYQLLNATRGEDFGGRPACADEDPELFFPLPGQTEQAERAKAVCAECPVLVSCQTFALRHGVPHGVWGGLTEDERAAIRRNTRRQATASVESAGTCDASAAAGRDASRTAGTPAQPARLGVA